MRCKNHPKRGNSINRQRKFLAEKSGQGSWERRVRSVKRAWGRGQEGEIVRKHSTFDLFLFDSITSLG
jgi:hypothetical protein